MLSVLSVPMMVAGSQPTMMTVDMAFRINSYGDYATANALGVISYAMTGVGGVDLPAPQRASGRSPHERRGSHGACLRALNARFRLEQGRILRARGCRRPRRCRGGAWRHDPEGARSRRLRLHAVRAARQPGAVVGRRALVHALQAAGHLRHCAIGRWCSARPATPCRRSRRASASPA